MRESSTVRRMVKTLLEDQDFREGEEYTSNSLAVATGSRREWFRKGLCPSLLDAGFLERTNPTRKLKYNRKGLHSFYNSLIERMGHEFFDLKARDPWRW